MNVRMLRKLEKWIMAEPRRFDMRNWSGNQRIINKNKPPCGTVGCLAGMACHMQGMNLTPGMSEVSKDEYIPGVATKILDLTAGQAERLFYIAGMHYSDIAWPASFAAAYKKAKTPTAKVKVAVARIEHFIKTKGAE